MKRGYAPTISTNFYDSQLYNNPSINFNAFNITTIPEGYTNQTRVGRQLTVDSIWIKGDFVLGPGRGANTASGDNVRIVVIADRGADGEMGLNYSDLFQTTNSEQLFISPFNWDNRDRYTVLWDMSKSLSAQCVEPQSFTSPAITGTITDPTYDIVATLPTYDYTTTVPTQEGSYIDNFVQPTNGSYTFAGAAGTLNWTAGEVSGAVTFPNYSLETTIPDLVTTSVVPARIETTYVPTVTSTVAVEVAPVLVPFQIEIPCDCRVVYNNAPDGTDINTGALWFVYMNETGSCDLEAWVRVTYHE